MADDYTDLSQRQRDLLRGSGPTIDDPDPEPVDSGGDSFTGGVRDGDTSGSGPFIDDPDPPELDPPSGGGGGGGGGGSEPGFDPRPPSRRDRSPSDDRDQSDPGSREPPQPEPTPPDPREPSAPDPPETDVPDSVTDLPQRQRDRLRGSGPTVEVPAGERERDDLVVEGSRPVTGAERQRIADETPLDREDIAGRTDDEVLLTDDARRERFADAFDWDPDLDARDGRLERVALQQADDLPDDVGVDDVVIGSGGPQLSEDFFDDRADDLRGGNPFVDDASRSRDRNEDLREAAAADDPLRDPEDFVVEDGEVRRRAAPFFEDQREALGLNPPEESRVRRGLQEASGLWSRGIQSDPIGTTAPSDIAAREQPGTSSALFGLADDMRVGGGEVFNLPGAVLGPAAAAEQAADLAQAEAETRTSLFGETIDDLEQTDELEDVDLTDAPDPFGLGVPEESAAAEERAATGAAARQAAETVTGVASESPGLLVGGAVAGSIFGLGAGRLLDAPRTAVRSARVRRAADDTVDFDDLASPSRGDSDLPKFDTPTDAPTSEAVSEVSRRARQTDEAAPPGDAGGALFHTTEADIADDLTVEEGGSELPGIFTSPDPSPLGLAEGPDAGSTSLRPRLPRPFSTDSDQIVTLPGDDVRGMPSTAQGAGYAVRGPDGELVETGLTRGQARSLAEDVGGQRAPDPTTDGYGFLTEQADPEAAFVRPTGSRTTELEAIFPPGGEFTETGLIGVNMPSGRTIPMRQFEPADAGDTALGATDELVDADSLPSSRVADPPAGQPINPFGAPPPTPAGQPISLGSPPPAPAASAEPPGSADSGTFEGESSASTPGFEGEISGSGSPFESGGGSQFGEPLDTTESARSAFDEPSSAPASGPTEPSGSSAFGEPAGTSLFGESTGTDPAPTSAPGSTTAPPSSAAGSESAPTSAPPSVFESPFGSPFGSPSGSPSSPPSSPFGSPFEPPGTPTTTSTFRDDRDRRPREEEFNRDPLDPETPLFENPIIGGTEGLFGSFGDGSDDLGPFGGGR